MCLTISLRFPTGRYAAAAWDNKDRSEWPPHPARLILALVDVLHKVGNHEPHRQALIWLCEQGAPSIVIPARKHIDIQSMDGFYVPQNPSQVESPKHPRKPRSFPTVFLDPDQPTVYFHWPEAVLSDLIAPALSELLRQLPRFGHSSSLVDAQQSAAPPPSGSAWQSYFPVDDTMARGEYHLRVPYDQLLDSAEKAFAADARSAEMTDLIKKAAISVMPTKPLKPTASSRGRHDPRHKWQSYISELPLALPKSPWDSRILLLERCDGPRAGLTSTWQIIDALHKTILDRWCRDPQRNPVPPWISGHLGGHGITGPAIDNHIAFFPITDVGHSYAQGRLMGIGLAFPRPETAGLDPVQLRLDWQQAMAALFPHGEILKIATASGEPLIALRPADPTDYRKSFQPSRWIGPSRKWSSVTPIVMDRHPKPNFKKDPNAWQESCREIIIAACDRLGIPKPIQIDVSPYSAIQGVPPSSAFAPPPARPGRPVRVHYHVCLGFAEKIVGPLLVGAGRFRGYGLLAPNP